MEEKKIIRKQVVVDEKEEWREYIQFSGITWYSP